MSTITNAITGMRAILAGVAGLTVPSSLPSTITVYPVAIVYARKGEVDQAMADTYRGMHTLHVDLLHSRTASPEAIESIAQWPDAFAAAFAASPNLNGYVVTIVSPWTYDIAEMQYVGTSHFGIRFEVTVKCLANV